MPQRQADQAYRKVKAARSLTAGQAGRAVERPAAPEGARQGRTRRSRWPSGGTEHARRPLSVSGALRGVPAEGVGRDRGSAAGEGFPQSALVFEDQQSQTARDNARQDNHAINPHRPQAPQAHAPAKTSDRLDHLTVRRETGR